MFFDVLEEFIRVLTVIVVYDGVKSIIKKICNSTKNGNFQRKN